MQLGKFFLPLDLTVNSGAINAGDFAWWTGSGIASFGAGLTMTSTLITRMLARLGVCSDTNPLSGGIANPLTVLGVAQSGKYGFSGTSGDTYSQFDEVTIGADAQTVVKTATLVQAAPTATAAGSDGTWSAAVHTVQVAILSAAGLSRASAATNVTVSATNHITVTPAAALPAWGKAFAVYIDGLLAGYQATNAATNYLAPATAQSASTPTTDALAVGYIDLPQGGRSAATSIAYSATPVVSGVAGGVIPVRLYPHNGLRAGLN
jgi:hypothetical protein